MIPPSRALVLLFLALPGAASGRIETIPGGVVMRTKVAEFRVLPSGYLSAQLIGPGQAVGLDDPGSPPLPGVSIRIGGSGVVAPVFDLKRTLQSPAEGLLGTHGRRIEVLGRVEPGIEARLIVEIYDEFNALALVALDLKNAGRSKLLLEQVSVLRRRLRGPERGAGGGVDLWSFQGSSMAWGQDEILRLSRGFARSNPMGPGRPDGLGGGVPVSAFWTAKSGTAIGHLEPRPLPLSIPVRSDEDGSAVAEVAFEPGIWLGPGQSYRTPIVFASVFAGDFYEALRMWSQALGKRGIEPAPPSVEAYQASWCGWGYQFNVTPAQMIGTIPKLKDLGIRWATLDDRWFENYGDWQPRKETFPGPALKEMVEEFHRQGLKVQLWWYPVGAEDGVGRYESHAYRAARVVEEHPDWLILDSVGRPARIARGLVALCPALPAVQRYHRTLIERFVRDWGFDGSKLDLVYSVPPCYNPRHGHRSPQESVEGLAQVYRAIFQATRAFKPDSVTQICPCGTPPNFSLLPYLDQAVTADPVGAVQVRRRIKMYKALLGPAAAVYGDHVELSEMERQSDDNWREVGRDFASTIGPGGVVGTKFIWPAQGPEPMDVFLDPAKEAHWRKWVGLFNAKRLASGTFRNLYVYGFDVPEAYAIEKEGRMYYAFFSPQPNASWEGEVEIRGLAPGRHRAHDYENDRDLGPVEAAHPRLPVRFTGHLLLEVISEGGRAEP